MVEVAKPDYLSLVNQGGSGFNISELVTAMVASEIEPKRSLHTDKKTKSDNAISGIGLLNSQTLLSQTAFNTRQNDSYFSVNSSKVQKRTSDDTRQAFDATDVLRRLDNLENKNKSTIIKGLMY